MSPHIADPKVVEVNLRKGLLEIGVELGGAFEFRNPSDEFYYFEIKFDEPGPPDAKMPLTGTAKKPITVQMPEETSEFKGKIVFKKKEDDTPVEGMSFLAKSCPGCGK
jgi:hypothetical protein